MCHTDTVKYTILWLCLHLPKHRMQALYYWTSTHSGKQLLRLFSALTVQMKFANITNVPCFCLSNTCRIWPFIVLVYFRNNIAIYSSVVFVECLPISFTCSDWIVGINFSWFLYIYFSCFVLCIFKSFVE